MRRRDLFPSDRGLQARMVLAAVGTPAFVIGAVAAAVLLLPSKVAWGLGAAFLLGTVKVVRERRKAMAAITVGGGGHPELRATVERLCVVADLPEPELVVHRVPEPNSWILDVPGRPARLHVTTGLIELLEPAELEAVVAHELSHVAHRDATVMTVVALPGELLGRGTMGGWGGWFLMLGQFVAMSIAAVSRLGTSTLSRHRELAADAGAARITGRPAALISALRKVSGEIARMPTDDFRSASALEAFGLLPTSDDAGGRLTATHPPIERRIAALERLERELHASRLPYAST